MLEITCMTESNELALSNEDCGYGTIWEGSCPGLDDDD